jgi:hypothetical protein
LYQQVAILEEGTGDLVWPFVGRGDSGTVRDAAAFPLDPAGGNFRRAVQLNTYADQVSITQMGTPGEAWHQVPLGALPLVMSS